MKHSTWLIWCLSFARVSHYTIAYYTHFNSPPTWFLPTSAACIDGLVSAMSSAWLIRFVTVVLLSDKELLRFATLLLVVFNCFMYRQMSLWVHLEHKNLLTMFKAGFLD